MRRVERVSLPLATQAALRRRQDAVDSKRVAGDLNVNREWKAARKSKPLKTVVHVLRVMAGRRQRCLYCCDSHATDIEHFWPKSGYVEKMFHWPNLLLCCTECGRLKGDRLPLSGGVPMLIDPTAENPWHYRDFEPRLGLIVARYDPAAGGEYAKGVATVQLLQLDRREAMNDGYLKSWRRVVDKLETALRNPPLDASKLISLLVEVDDHGLLGWCFAGGGQDTEPFATLRVRHPDVWAACATFFS